MGAKVPQLCSLPRSSWITIAAIGNIRLLDHWTADWYLFVTVRYILFTIRVKKKSCKSYLYMNIYLWHMFWAVKFVESLLSNSSFSSAIIALNRPFWPLPLQKVSVSVLISLKLHSLLMWVRIDRSIESIWTYTISSFLPLLVGKWRVKCRYDDGQFCIGQD